MAMRPGQTAAKQVSNYAKRMERLSNRIFGEIVRPTDYQSTKVVKIMAKQPTEDIEKRTSRYYPPHPMFHYLAKLLRAYGLFRDEHQDFIDEIERLRVLRGKGRPKIGEGKKAMLRKQGLG